MLFYVFHGIKVGEVVVITAIMQFHPLNSVLSVYTVSPLPADTLRVGAHDLPE